MVDLKKTYAPIESKILDIELLIEDIVRARLKDLEYKRTKSMELVYQEEDDVKAPLNRRLSLTEYKPDICRVFIDSDILMPKFNSKSEIFNEKIIVLVFN
jgi:hypothetical protein